MQGLALTAGLTEPFLTTWLNHCWGQLCKALWNISFYEEPSKFSFKPFCERVNELEGNLCVKMEGERINLYNCHKVL